MSSRVRNIEFIEAGHSIQIERLANPKSGSLKPVRFPSSVAIIEHDTQGIILFDTGYSPRLKQLTRNFSERLLSQILPVHVEPEDTAIYKLEKKGIRPKDVSHVVLSHFHSDHVAGVMDFPNSKLVYSKKELESLNTLSSSERVRHAFCPELLPTDMDHRFCGLGNRVPIPGLGRGWSGYDLFQDESIFVVPLPGHTIGHMGLFIPDVKGETLFLIGDAAWLRSAVTDNVAPTVLAQYLIFDDAEEYKRTLNKLHRLKDPIQIVPCHCNATLQGLSSHEFKS